MADRTGWQRALESELRAMSNQLDVPQAGDASAAVRRRLDVRAARRRNFGVLSPGAFARRPAWRVALAVLVAAMAIMFATPQGRAVISHVLRLAGVEIRQGRSPVPSPRSTGSLPGALPSALPGERRMSLAEARHAVSFPILVPAALGRPGEVLVSDHGRVASLVYRRTQYGTLLVDEFAGHLDQILFEKFVHFSDVTRVEVSGREALWIKGPHMLIYIDRAGYPVNKAARLTTGNTLIWGTRRVALRLEGNVGERTALAIAKSAR